MTKKTKTPTRGTSIEEAEALVALRDRQVLAAIAAIGALEDGGRNDATYSMRWTDGMLYLTEEGRHGVHVVVVHSDETTKDLWIPTEVLALVVEAGERVLERAEDE